MVFAALLFSAELVSDLAAREVRFGAAAVLLAEAVDLPAAGLERLVLVPLPASASPFAAAVLRVPDAARAGALAAVDLVSAVAFFAAARFGLAVSSPAGAAALRVVARLGFASLALSLADFVAARRAMACARRLAGVFSVISAILLCVLQACHLRSRMAGALQHQDGVARHRYASGDTSIPAQCLRIADVHTWIPLSRENRAIVNKN
ncbi:MAG: hypothetical protein JOZ05_15660 [Acetobacteraceae bacterium]|nr:hypothetical protein [Acetobacteraceae bacterium]